MKRSFWLNLCILLTLGLSACSAATPPPAASAAMQATPDPAQTYLASGDRAFEQKDYDQAIVEYSQAIQLNPNFAEAYNNRGLAYALKGKDQMALAIADYDQAIRLKPDYANAINNRGVALMASGHPEEARRDFDRAIRLKPDFPQAHSNRGNYYLRAKQYLPALLDFYRANRPLVSLVIALAIMALVLIITFLLSLPQRPPAARPENPGSTP